MIEIEYIQKLLMRMMRVKLPKHVFDLDLTYLPYFL